MKSPQNETPPSLKKPPATGPVITGNKGEVSTPTSFDPAKAFYDSCHATAFQIARLMLRKALEWFLSVYLAPAQGKLEPGLRISVLSSRISQAASLILSFEV